MASVEFTVKDFVATVVLNRPEAMTSVDPQMRVKMIAFRAHGARPHEPALVAPTHEELEAAAANLQVADLQLCLV